MQLYLRGPSRNEGEGHPEVILQMCFIDILKISLKF